jgi:competence protein ComFC
MHRFRKALLELLYPKSIKCCVCGREAKEAVCGSCLAAHEYIEGRVCLKCGKGLEDDYPENTCPDCRREKKHFEMAFSCFGYKDMGKDIIHKLKYEGCRDVSYVLARLMHQKLQDENISYQAVVPVPIHSGKLETRGFNQARLIAQRISELSGAALWDCLERTKETTEQFKLDKIHRILNVNGAFCINLLYNGVKYDDIVLVDDVYTTGSTADECSRILKQHGVQRIYVVTAATGSNT